MQKEISSYEYMVTHCKVTINLLPSDKYKAITYNNSQ